MLHSWATSKARRERPRADAVLLRMMELEYLYQGVCSSGDGGSLVGSKAFTLVVRCYAGSTRELLKKLDWIGLDWIVCVCVCSYFGIVGLCFWID